MAGAGKGGWCVPPPQRCLTVLSPQDSPDASREPVAKLSVSCVQAHQHHHPRMEREEWGSSLTFPLSTEQAHLCQPARDQPLQLC